MESHSRVRISDAGAKFTKPNIVVGVPDVGLVGVIACSYLVEQLKLEQVGYIDSDMMPQVMVVHGSLPNYPVHIFGRDDLVVVLSEVPFSPHLSFELTKELTAWAKAKEARVMIGITGLASKRREESSDEKPSVLGVPSNQKVFKELKPLGVIPFEEGVITGTYAGMLKQCMSAGQDAVVLMGESLLQFPDPAAAASVIEVISSMFSLKVDVKALMQESEEIRLKSRELMQQTQQTQQQEPPRVPGVYR